MFLTQTVQVHCSFTRPKKTIISYFDYKSSRSHSTCICSFYSAMHQPNSLPLTVTMVTILLTSHLIPEGDVGVAIVSPGQVGVATYLEVRQDVGMVTGTDDLHGGHRATTFQIPQIEPPTNIPHSNKYNECTFLWTMNK